MVASSERTIIERVRDLTRYDEREDEALALPYGMTSFQAALGLSQLVRLDDFLAKRQEIYHQYVQRLSPGGVVLPFPAPPGEDIHYRFIVKARRGAQAIIERLNGKGIAARRPVFRQLYRYTGTEGLSGTEKAYHEDVSIPIYPTLTIGEQKRVTRELLTVLGM